MLGFDEMRPVISNPALDKIIWILIYGGILMMSVGVFILRADAALGWFVIAAGGFETLAGAVLIYVRSRRTD
jgi:hypothetical protein